MHQLFIITNSWLRFASPKLAVGRQHQVNALRYQFTSYMNSKLTDFENAIQCLALSIGVDYMITRNIMEYIVFLLFYNCFDKKLNNEKESIQ